MILKNPAIVSVFCCGLAMLAAIVADAQENNPAFARPNLEQLNRETQSLYRDVKGSVVRVQMPVPQWVLEVTANPMAKWEGRLDPAMKQKLEQGQTSGSAVVRVDPSGNATTEPSTQPADEDRARVIIVPSNDAVGSPTITPRDSAAVPPTMNHIGVILDDRGHVLVPIYVEKETAEQQPFLVANAEGKICEGRFIGSDRKTNLTLIRLEKGSIGKPARFSAERPADGALVLLLSPSGGSAKLSLWTGGQHDQGVVVALDGQIAGIARFGQFLAASAWEPVVKQLIEHGHVKRASLGVLIREVSQSDPLRQEIPELGTRPAIRIERMLEGSAAHKAGLQVTDLILSLGDEPVGDPPSFGAAIAARDGKTDLKILRAGKEITITVELKQQ